jgi:hypothetical protein
MKKWQYGIAILTCIMIQVFLASACNGCELCNGEDKTIACLKANFNALYRLEYKRFWEILKLSEKKAINCKMLSDTASFMELANLDSHNAEFNEYYNEVIENLLKTKTTCFLDTLSLLAKPQMIAVINKLKHPIFTDRSEIQRLFEREKKNNVGKYSEVMKLFFEEHAK